MMSLTKHVKQESVTISPASLCLYDLGTVSAPDSRTAFYVAAEFALWLHSAH
jgi:hypothetical protein